MRISIPYWLAPIGYSLLPKRYLNYIRSNVRLLDNRRAMHFFTNVSMLRLPFNDAEVTWPKKGSKAKAQGGTIARAIYV